MSEAEPELNVLKEILSALPDTVLVVGEDRRIRFFSRDEVGYRREDIIGKDVHDFVAPDARDEHAKLLDGVFETMQPAQQLTEIVNAEGDREWYEGTMIPLVRDDRVTAVLIVTRNVTERRLAEQELDMLRSLLPVCAWCKKVRDDDGEWQPLEVYLQSTSRSRITHGMCPECERKVFGEPDADSA